MTVLKEGTTKAGKSVRLINDGVKLLELYSIEEWVKEKGFKGWRMIYGIYNHRSEAEEKFKSITAS